MLALALVSLASATLLGCGPAPNATHPRHVRSSLPAGAVRVVPADQVKGTCQCDDDDLVADDDSPARKPTEYVKLRDWQPPPAVEELEASLAARGPEQQSFTTFPVLTLHQRIGDTTYRRFGRGNVHAR